MAAPAQRGRRPYGLIATGVVLSLAIALLPPTLSAAVLGAVGGGALLLARPDVALYLLIFSIPYASIQEVHLGGINATVTEFIAFCGGAAFLMTGAIKGQLRVRGAWWSWSVLLYAGVMVLSMTQATQLNLSLKELLKLGEMLLTYLLVLSYINTPARLQRLLLLIVLAAASQALYGLVQTVAHVGPSSFLRGGVLRANGTFDQPNPFAGYLNLTLPLLLASVLTGVSLIGRLTRPALIVIAAAVLVSGSRGALLATLVALAVMLAVYVRRSRPLLVAGGIVLFGLVVGAVFGIVPASVTSRVATSFGVGGVDVVNPTPLTWSVAERLAHWIAGLNMFFAHPWLGVGIGNYPAAYPQYRVITVGDVWANPLGHAHNYYINVAAEAGVVGLAAFLIMLIAAFWIVASLYRRAATPWARTVTLGTLGVLATVAVHSFFDDVFVHAMEAQLALMMGVATVAWRLSVVSS